MKKISETIINKVILFSIATCLYIQPVHVKAQVFQQSLSNRKVMIVLQENQGKVSAASLPANTPQNVINLISAAIDATAENFEDIKSSLQGNGKYNKIINLTDVNCTRSKLLATLINETVAGNIIDLYFFGHGNDNSIGLHDGVELTNTSILELLKDARLQKGSKFNFNLRLVYSCSCHGAGLNNDWVSIGADAAVGPLCNNWMSEPMITLFLNKYINENKTVTDAANESFNEAKLFWSTASITIASDWKTPDPEDKNCKKENRMEGSIPLIAGNGNFTFNLNEFPHRNDPIAQISWYVNDFLDNVTGDVIPEGTYRIASYDLQNFSKKYLSWQYDCYHNHTSNCQLVIDYRGSTDRNNNFKVTHKVTGGYWISIGQFTMAADASGILLQEHSNNALMIPNDGFIGDEETWFFHKLRDDIYLIRNWFSKKFLDATDNCTNQISCLVNLFNGNSNDPTQVWILERVY